MMIEHWRVMEELDRIREWDPDAVCDTFNITTEELMRIGWVQLRAMQWIEENMSE